VGSGMRGAFALIIRGSITAVYKKRWFTVFRIITKNTLAGS
jgi:hypothetical protein